MFWASLFCIESNKAKKHYFGVSIDKQNNAKQIQTKQSRTNHFVVPIDWRTPLVISLTGQLLLK
jgi:hypothetical protein